MFDTSTRLLELSQSRRLLTVHNDVAGRLQTVLDVELPQLIIVRMLKRRRSIDFYPRCASAVLAMGLCMSVCLSVRHKSVFYRNG